MSSADILHPSSVTYTATIHASHPGALGTGAGGGGGGGGGGGDHSAAKRTLFGRKKKSSANLTASPSPNTLVSHSSSIPTNDSVESFGAEAGGDDGLLKKGVMNVFKRKSRVENPAATSTSSLSLGNTDDGAPQEEEGEGRNVAVYEDEDGNLSDKEQQDSSNTLSEGYLNTSSSTITNKNPSGKPKLFGRRSTSPMAPIARASTMIPVENPQSKENVKTSPLSRPATSGGESRLSQERSRRVGRLSIGTSEAHKVSGVPALGHVVGDDRRKFPGLNFPAVAIDSETSDAPKTTITPPTPTDQPVSQFPLKSPVGAVVNGPKRRRSRTDSLSNTPSKLSQSISSETVASPPAEGLPSTNNNTGGGAGGFFQTMFSAAQNAAQNAATTLTSNIPLNLNSPNRSRSTTMSSDDKTKGSTAPPEVEEMPEREREPAVKTLGMGELNLATLGIVPEASPTTQTDEVTATSKIRLGNPRSTESKEDLRLQNDSNNRHSVPQSAMTPVHNGGFETAGESPLNHRTQYAEDLPYLWSPNPARSSAGEGTPDRNSLIGVIDEDETMTDGRSASLRSITQQRHRGSSAASQGNFPPPVSRPTGFAVASKKRNRDFHNLFKSVPEEDYLIEDYGCALQREILLQGRLYVSEGHICFYSNILGWVTTLVISFDEVMSVEKKSTALLFPNAIVIQTLHARHIFASFISRDSTYDLILGLWNVGHPQIVAGNGEAHLDGAPPGGESGEEEDDEYEDETDDELDGSFTDAGDGPFEDDSTGAVIAASKGPSRKPSQLPLGGGAVAGDTTDGGAGAAVDFPGPKAHAPTACGDDDKHYDKLLCDEILPVPLGHIYSLLFGPASYPFVTHLLAEEEKVLELQIPNNGEWTEVDGKKQRSFTYVKPLNSSIGPSKTRCNITETIDHFDLDDHVSVTVSTQTPDVPSGGVFSVKTRYCLMWGEGNGTRMISNCTVEWTGKSWIKGPIEKGASDGQVAYNKSLLASLRREIAPKRAVAVGKAGAKGGKHRRRKDTAVGGAGGGRALGGTTATAAAAPATVSWGILEPLRPFFGPLVDIFQPMLPANFGVVVVTVLVTWVVASRFSSAPTGTAVSRGGYMPEKHWEDQWRYEEEGLWDWLEGRVGLDGLPTVRQNEARQKVLEKKVRAKVVAESIKEREMVEALEVLKERLEVMEKLVEQRKSTGEAGKKAKGGE